MSDMEVNRQELDNSQILKYEDFESLRCDKCKQYLNCPNIMMYIDAENQQKPYTICGRCFNSKEEEEDKDLPKPILNISAETLAAVTPFPCRYYNNGCRQRRLWPKIKLHEQQCMFRLFECSAFQKNLQYLTGIELIKKYNDEYTNLISHNGIIPLSFDKDFEETYLIHQNTDLFLFKLRYRLEIQDKIWFTVTLLENNNSRECNIAFNDNKLKNTVTLKHIPFSEETCFDLKAVKTLLGDNAIISKCQVFLNMPLSEHSSSELLKDIECPSCWDYMKGRIFICSSGHSICGECKKNLECCPVCREGEMSSARNYSLEKVMSQALFPCKNCNLGCSYVSNLDEMILHGSYCKFSTDEDSMS